MKTEVMKALSAEELENVNGGFLGMFDHVHCTQPEPGSCACVPLGPGDIGFDLAQFKTFLVGRLAYTAAFC